VRPSPIGTIMVTGPGGATFSVDLTTFEVTVTGGLDHETYPFVPLTILMIVLGIFPGLLLQFMETAASGYASLLSAFH